ncbi:MAG: hypothetical protein RR548_04960 [Carnobacterium sp.]|uniref:hypothetical protein n=1 Tax=Carnobacterium sp. TaxID=48221 RepID=UPI002FC82C3C
MIWPSLIPLKYCTTPIHLKIESAGISEDGEPIILYEGDATCNYQESAKRILNEQQKLVNITGIALFSGDIVPNVETIPGGEVKVFGSTRRICRATKARNPDGSVNYTMLDLI